MDKTEEEKKCGNCRYFSWHYLKFKGRLLKTDCGNCINPDKKVTDAKNRMDKYCVCGLWQPCKLQLQERRENLKSELRRIASRLDDIALILKDDE